MIKLKIYGECCFYLRVDFQYEKFRGGRSTMQAKVRLDLQGRLAQGAALPSNSRTLRR
jgi:hypothetical protein